MILEPVVFGGGSLVSRLGLGLGYWTTRVELARLASNNKQATSSAGPFLVSRAEGAPKLKKNVTTVSGIIFRNFLGNNFFQSDPQVVAKGGLLGFWPVLGCGH